MTPMDYAVIRPMFGGHLSQSQVDGINDILAAWDEWGDGDHRKLAYILATVLHETARTMQPVKEYGSAAYLKAKKYWPYIGRGHVQLTWKDNYAKVGKTVGVDLVADPDKALDPQLSARICVQGMMEGWFTGKKLSTYVDTPLTVDYANARRVVNGLDRADEIAMYAIKFATALRSAQKPVQTPEPEPAPAQPEPTSPVASLILRALAGIASFIVSLFRRG